MTEPPSGASARGSGLRRVRLAVARSGLWPRSPRPRSLRGALRSAHAAERVVGIALVGGLLVYLCTWISGSAGWLLDPQLQNDDARTHLIPFHRYGPERALRGDPMADEMLSQVPPGFHLVYRLLVPVTDVYWAAKVVQAACLAMILAAGWLTARRRGGLVLAVLLVALAFHEPTIVNRIAGGLQRAFGHPLLLLYLTGVIDAAWRRRALCILAGALLYPPVVLVMLATEGLLAAAAGLDLRRRAVRRRFARLASATLAFAAITVLFLGGGAAAGPTPTYEQAVATGTFAGGGRSHQVPFAPAAPAFVKALTEIFTPVPTALAGNPIIEWHLRQDSALALAACALLAFVVACGCAPRPRAAVGMILGSVLAYLLARWVAFKLYVPHRFFTFGVVAASVVLVAAVVGQLAPAWPRPRRFLVRAGVASAAFTALLVLTGLGVAGTNGQSIDGRDHASLVARLRQLPVDSRIAAHPMDGDHVPFWAARATVVSYETTNPWRLAAWERELQRGRDTLSALYAVDQQEVLAYLRKYRVTHLLLNANRYGRPNLPHNALLFEPLGAHVRELLAMRPAERHVLRRLPPEAVIWHGEHPWILIDAGLLESAWQPATSAPAPPAPPGP